MNYINNLLVKPFIFNFLVYWSYCFFWLICDLYVEPKYRINKEIDWKLYKKSVIYTLLNQIAITPIVLLYMIPLWKWRGISFSFEELSILESLIKLLCCVIFSEIIFFYTHKICHIKLIYQKVHKIHHQWKYPCAVSAAYCHPLEYIFCNLSTLLLPPLIIGLNWYVIQLWFTSATIVVINHHCGYKIIPGSLRHIYHHKFKHRAHYLYNPCYL